MLAVSNLYKRPFYIMAETPEKMIDVHTRYNPFIGTEYQANVYTEALITQFKIQGVPITAMHVYPLYNCELRK